MARPRVAARSYAGTPLNGPVCRQQGGPGQKQVETIVSGLSPLTRIQGIRAPLIVFAHDKDDGVIPVSDSRQVKQALAGKSGVRYTEFALFQHATPRKLAILPLAQELKRFYSYVHPLFRATTD